MTSRLSGFVAGVVLATCIAAVHSWWHDRNTDAMLLSDVHGGIEEVCVHYTRAFHAQTVETFGDFFSGLGENATVRVIVEDHSDFEFLIAELSKLGLLPSARLCPVVTGVPITPWAKDRFGSMVSSRGPVLAVPPLRSMSEGPRANDEKVPEILAAALPGLECRSLPFFFDGGDLLADADSVYIAPNFIARNQAMDSEGVSRLLSLIESAFKKKPVTIGDDISQIPNHHIGMFVTPLGNRTLAVGDPDLGLRLWHGDESIRTAVDVTAEEEHLAPFRNAARCLEEKGFTVIRIPLLVTKLPQVYVSYNNAIVEHTADNKRIFMPTYGIPALDKSASGCLEAEGWNIVPVRVDKVYRHTGSLRCLVGIIRRST